MNEIDPQIIPESQSKKKIRQTQIMIAAGVSVIALFILLASGFLLPNAVFFGPTDPVVADIIKSSNNWKNTEAPFSISEYSQKESDTFMNLKITNKFPTDLMLDKIEFAGHIDQRPAHGAYYAKLTESKFEPAQKKDVTLLFSKGMCSNGEIYRYLVNITYHHPGVQKQVQQGQMPLVGRCQ